MIKESFVPLYCTENKMRNLLTSQPGCLSPTARENELFQCTTSPELRACHVMWSTQLSFIDFDELAYLRTPRACYTARVIKLHYELKMILDYYTMDYSTTLDCLELV